MNASSAPSSAAASATRRAWMAVLARTPRADLEAAFAAALGDEPAPSFDWLRAPQTGLAMVRGRVGGTGNAFNLGETTVTRATLRLRAAQGHEATTVGVACHLGRDKRRAELAALADALLQQPERHAHLHAQLIEPLAARLADKRAARRDDTASTKVEFFTMVRGDA